MAGQIGFLRRWSHPAVWLLLMVLSVVVVLCGSLFYASRISVQHPLEQALAVNSTVRTHAVLPGTDVRNILLLNSYHKGYVWSDEIIRGVEEALAGQPVELHVEYLDTKRQFDEPYRALLKLLLRQKHDKHRFDLVITSDNNAFDFMLNQADDLFEQLPLVFCGVNSVQEKELAGRKNMTGVNEQADLRGNLLLIQRMHPLCRRVVVVTDDTTTGRRVQAEVHQLIAEQGEDGLQVELLYDVTLGELAESVRQLDEQTVVLYTFFFRDRDGIFVDEERGARLVCSQSAVPVYGAWNFNLNHGIVGGYLISGYDQGVAAAQKALRILTGTPASEIPVTYDSPVRCRLDYRQVERLKIPAGRIPDGCEVVNRPGSFYAAYKDFIWNVALSFCMLSLALVGVVYGLLRARRSSLEYRTFFENSSDAMLVISNGRFVKCNKSAVEMLGYEHKPELLRTHPSVISPTEQPDGQSSFEKAERMMALAYENGTHRFEWVHLRKDGSEIPVEVSLTAIRNEQGDQLHTVWRDLTERKRADQALVENQERLQSVLRVAPVGIGMVRDRVLINVNPQVCEITGYFYEELIGQSARMLYVTEEEFLRVGQEKYDQISERGTGTVETQWMRKDGEIRDVLLSSTPVNVEDLASGVIFTALDITKRKQAEEAVKASAHKLALHVEQTPLGVILWDLDFKVAEWNPSAERIFGYSQNEAIGRHARFIVPEEAQVHVDAVWDQLLSGTGGTRSTNENITKDGRTILCEWYNTPLVDHTGKVIGVAAEVMDVTERRQAEVERNQLMLAIEQSDDIVVITDAEANIQYVNPAFERITGYDRDEVMGQNPRILQSGRHTDAFYRKMWETLLSKKSWSGQLINKRKSGSIYTEDATISPVCDRQGNIVNYVAAKRDVTHELELEDQLRQAQKMEAVGQMAGGIAHDFNNLLQVIGGYAELSLMDASEDNPCVSALNEIQDASMRGKQLVSQLLAFSRRQVIHPVDLNLNQVIDKLLKMIRGIIGEHIDLDFIAGHNLATIHADHGLMEQVLVNLCVNARDAMPNGGKITVETENVLIDGDYVAMHHWATPGRYVLLSVSDSGCGMDSRTQEHIFEPFFTTKEVGKGTGLGLSTVFGIIKQHNGHVSVYSEPDRGTIFKIYLPTVARKASEVNRRVPETVKGGTETLLVAEDDETVLKLAELLLTDAGYTVFTARDGKEAIRVFEENADKIDGVMFDVVMPRMGGKEAMDRILELRPGLPHLFASGYSENAVHTNFIQKRGLHLLSKPYQAESLLRMVREVFDEAVK